MKIDYEKEARELLTELGNRLPTDGEIALTVARLKKCYNYGVGYKRDRTFLSKEKHEKKYLPKRKSPAKVYKKK